MRLQFFVPIEPRVEVLTDAVASRNVWYYFDDDILIAATTQRAIVALLGKFAFNRAAVPWMLTNGSLGPVPSWDLRVKRLGPDSTLTVDRESWHLSVVAKPDIVLQQRYRRKLAARILPTVSEEHLRTDPLRLQQVGDAVVRRLRQPRHPVSDPGDSRDANHYLGIGSIATPARQ